MLAKTNRMTWSTIVLALLTWSGIGLLSFGQTAYASSPTFSFSGSSSLTDLTNANGVQQDGGIAMYRAPNGELYALLGHLKVWKGTSVNDLTYQYDMNLNFSLGAAGTAFNGSYYPDEGGNKIRSRGIIWPMGLYIDANGKFYAYIHNETGWYAGGTGYNTTTGGDPGEPDFRHIGLMTSTDQGQNWDFEGWVITGSQPAYTTAYRPDGLTTGGQPGPSYRLGAGDFSLFDNPNDDYLYIAYAEITVTGSDHADHIYIARASKSNPSVWHKYYNGDWTEPGNSGLETPIIAGGNVPSLGWSAHLNQYIMTSYNRPAWGAGLTTLQISTSPDLVNWSVPQLLSSSDTTFNKPYWTLVNSGTSGNLKVVGQTFEMLYHAFADDIRKVSITTALSGPSYQASIGFGSVQGANQWSYQYWNGSTYTDMSWDSGNVRWAKSGTFSIVGNNWQHPDTNADSVRKFTAPRAGILQITGVVRKGDVGGDGVKVKIVKNGTQIWPTSGWQSIGPNDTTGYSVNVDIAVAANDAIYFIVNSNSDISYDKTVWDPVLSYKDFQASIGFGNIQGADQWSYQYWNGSAYTDMSWDSGNGRWTKNGSFSIVGNNWQHPDTNADSVRKFTAPRAGNLQITGVVRKDDVGGDGVKVKIVKNGTQIWPASGWQSIAPNDTTGYSVNIGTAVAANDAIYFIVNSNNDMYYDRTVWDPVITYQ